MYNTPNATIEILREKIEDALEDIQEEEISNSIRNMNIRIAKCIEEDGRHFEQLILLIFSNNLIMTNKN